jgi:hypothetical protein
MSDLIDKAVNELMISSSLDNTVTQAEQCPPGLLLDTRLSALGTAVPSVELFT